MLFDIRLFSARALAVLLFIFAAFNLSADDTAPHSGPEEPDKTEIILPEMYLEIEDLTIEEINAVIPDNDSVLLSSLELPLPEPDQIEIPAEVFAVSDPDLPASAAAAAAAGGSAFFSEGTIGGGTSANITGDISLYHIGEQPDFRLRYFHDSRDGFAGHQAGEGYSSREELIEAELNYNENDLAADILISYNELEDGLQGNPDYFSLTRRIPELTSDLSWSFRENLMLTGSLDVAAAGFQLNSSAPLGFNIFSVDPEAGIVLGRERLNVGLVIDYDIEGEFGGSISQGLGGRLVFNAEPSELFRLSVDAALLWDNYSKLFFPFSVGVSGTGAAVDYNISAGYTAYYQDRTDLWDVFPTAAGPQNAESLGVIPLSYGWTADAGLRWNITDRFALRAVADFSMLTNSLTPTVSSLGGFNSLAAVNSTCLGTAAGFYLEITDNFSFDIAWEGQLLSDIDWFRPRHQFTSEIELTSVDRNMGLVGNVGFSIYDERQSWFINNWLPELGLEGYFRISDGFVLSVSGEDLGAIFLEEGRTVWNSYLDKGAALQAKIKISL